jgi:hypothetical protein
MSEAGKVLTGFCEAVAHKDMCRGSQVLDNNLVIQIPLHSVFIS